jgi:predicted enzyme related to lactoylglutathione lyase
MAPTHGKPSQPVVHLELRTPNMPAAVTFYSELCGWRAERIVSSGGPYMALGLGSEGDDLDGGIVETDCRRSVWLPYVEVPEITPVTERARGLGAEVLLEPREGPAGWRSVVSSPAGGEIAFWQSKAPRDEFRNNGRSVHLTDNEKTTGGNR